MLTIPFYEFFHPKILDWEGLKKPLRYPLQNIIHPSHFTELHFQQNDLFVIQNKDEKNTNHPDLIDSIFSYDLFLGYLSGFPWKTSQEQAISALEKLNEYTGIPNSQKIWKNLLHVVIQGKIHTLEKPFLDALNQILKRLPEPTDEDITQIWIEAMQNNDQQPLLLWLLHQGWTPTFQPLYSWPWLAASFQAWKTWAWLIAENPFFFQSIDEARKSNHQTIQKMMNMNYAYFPQDFLNYLMHHHLLPEKQMMMH